MSDTLSVRFSSVVAANDTHCLHEHRNIFDGLVCLLRVARVWSIYDGPYQYKYGSDCEKSVFGNCPVLPNRLRFERHRPGSQYWESR